MSFDVFLCGPTELDQAVWSPDEVLEYVYYRKVATLVDGGVVSFKFEDGGTAELFGLAELARDRSLQFAIHVLTEDVCEAILEIVHRGPMFAIAATPDECVVVPSDRTNLNLPSHLSDWKAAGVKTSSELLSLWRGGYSDWLAFKKRVAGS